MCKILFNNKGMAVVEATLILPIFIFGVLAVYHMIQCKITENIIYDATVETAEYISELGYINRDNIYVPELYFSSYVDEEDMIDRYVVGGVDGIDFWGSDFELKDEYFSLQVNYTIKISVPFIPELKIKKSISVTQRYYVGDVEDGDGEGGKKDVYVYITDNMEAYHSTRLCTHLNLSVEIVPFEEAITTGYEPCEYCGYEDSGLVIITDYGDKYHSNPHCSGLKRTIYRVKLSEIGGIPGCTRCVN